MAIVLPGISDTYTFKSGDDSFTIDLNKAKDGDTAGAMVERIFRYGLRLFNDSANSAKARATATKKPHDHKAYVEAMIEEFYKGQFTRTRDSSLTDVDREYLVVLVAWTVDAANGKYTKAKVQDVLKDKGADYLIERLAKARGLTTEDLDKSLSATAEANVKARKPSVKAVASLEL